MDEAESLHACEALFSEELKGHRLMTNRSLWTSFLLVRNESWHRGNVVLLGDAAHTAHFSIGSGTKLAMEDAIALAQAFLRHPRDLERALVDYELERQPVVERFQQAAGESAAYFSRVEHYAHMDPMPFAFNLLTRSGRVTHANLAQRDPQFVRVLDAWFHGGERGAVTPPPLFAPWRDLRNRVVRAAARAGAAGRDGAQRRRARARRARGRDARWAHLAGHADALIVSGVRRVDEVHASGAHAGVLLTHAGRRGSTRPSARGADLPLREGGWPLLAPSPIPYAPRMPAPREMDAAAMTSVCDAFAAAARRAAGAGFDVLELDMGHGYLLASFLSPESNRREDEYGGDLAGRLRFPLQVLDAVREAWPQEQPARGAAERHGRHAARAQAGRRHRDRARAGRARLRAGPRRGRTDGARGRRRPIYRRGFLTPLADRVRAEARVPTLVGGYLTTPDEANTILGAGRADLCLLDVPDSDLERQVLEAPEPATAAALA